MPVLRRKPPGRRHFQKTSSADRFESQKEQLLEEHRELSELVRELRERRWKKSQTSSVEKGELQVLSELAQQKQSQLSKLKLEVSSRDREVVQLAATTTVSNPG